MLVNKIESYLATIKLVATHFYSDYHQLLSKPFYNEHLKHIKMKFNIAIAKDIIGNSYVAIV